MARRVYLDYAAATPIREEVKKAMEPWHTLNFANPSAIYREAEETKKALEEARLTTARHLGVKPSDVVYVASSTEANNLAIFGVARNGESVSRRTGHIITTEIEHPSISEPLRVLEKKGWRISRVSVDKEGFVNLEEFRAALSSQTILVTLAWANPDIGVIQPVRDIAKVVREHEKGSGTRVALHIDGSQVGGALGVNVPAIGADLFTLSSSKIYGPRGIAALVVRSGTRLEALIYGGGQENEFRGGTENVAAAVGFARAVELARKEQKNENERLLKLRDELIERVLALPDVILTGPDPKAAKIMVRLPNHASFAFKNIKGEELIIRLDEFGFAVGTGSACATNKDEASQAVSALNLSAGYSTGTLRVTLGKQTSSKDLDSFLPILVKTIEKIRAFNKI